MMSKVIFSVALCMAIPTIWCAVEDFPEEMKELIAMLRQTCLQESGATNEMVENTKIGIFPDDTKLKCYMKCLLIEMASMGEDGMIDIEATIGVLPPNIKPKLEPAIRKCATVVGADKCETAYLTYKCYYDFNPEYYCIV